MGLGEVLVSNVYQVLVDSDAFVGRFFDEDAHFERAEALFNKTAKENIMLLTTSAVVGEAATVLSNRCDQKTALAFLEIVEDSLIPVIHIDAVLHNEALTLFKQQAKRGTSYVDCTNVVVARHFDVFQILSFDKAYPKDFGLKLFIL